MLLNFHKKQVFSLYLLCAEWKYVPTYNYVPRKNILQECEQNKDKNIKTEFVTNRPSKIKTLKLIYIQKLVILDRIMSFQTYMNSK